jgi:hypothetical protein
MTIVWHLGGQACQVELILNEVLVHLAKELVATQVAEPTDPG